MKKIIQHVYAAVSVFLIMSLFSVVYAQSSSAVANRQTAVRCLQLAKEYLNQKSWDSAVSEANLGLAYDNSLADLWYILAAAEYAQGASKAEILPIVTNALNSGEWKDYNRDNARILYAELLCDTDSFQKAIDVLDDKPLLLSADADCIRIKAYYCQHTPEALAKARDRLDADRRIYLSDSRFARLFFRYENKKSVPSAQKLADGFIAQLPLYKDSDAELQIYAARFSTGIQRERMLKSFSARGLKHPLYAVEALDAGLISQQAAFDYFTDFADKSITLELLNTFAPLITEENVKKDFAAYLTAYCGTITEDTDSDMLPNLTVVYSRGRPASVSWDRNNDGIPEWTAVCDFGATQSVELSGGISRVEYGTYPSAVKAVYRDKSKKNTVVSFNLVPDAFSFAPYDMKTSKILSSTPGCEFFIPEVKDPVPVLTQAALLKTASSYEMPSQEYDDAVIHFLVLDGILQNASYYRGGTMYAQTIFKNGRPDVRILDMDGDGVFETTETFGYDDKNNMHRTEEEQNLVMKDLFGMSSMATQIYIKMFQVDRNGDSVADYTEEYLADNGKISSWDYDGDGLWDVRYERLPCRKGEILKERSFFYIMPNHVLITVLSENEKPVSVISGTGEDAVTETVEEGSTENFYWIDGTGTPQNEEKIIDSINQITDQGVCIIVQNGRNCMLAVRIGRNIFGRMLPDAQDNGTENDKTGSQ